MSELSADKATWDEDEDNLRKVKASLDEANAAWDEADATRKKSYAAWREAKADWVRANAAWKLAQATREWEDWRNLPDGILFRYAELCRQEQNRQMKKG